MADGLVHQPATGLASASGVRLLDEQDWLPRAEAHRRRADDATAAHRDRARRGEHHPVWDFLFTYYSLRPARLRVWHPGWGVALTGQSAAAYLNRPGYVSAGGSVTVGAGYLRSRLPAVGFIAGLLESTAAREPRFGCFGMHEWAMVYRSGEIRHAGVPLRLGARGTDEVVESMPLRCSHFDAYRFFTAPAMARNETQLTRGGQAGAEQPGCLHANMDLYKWAYKLGPLADSDLLMDCLDLAGQARELDMRASPYDLRAFGFEPITVEEPAGRTEYVRRQNRIAQQAAALRARLLHRCRQLLVTSADRISRRTQEESR